MKLKGKVAVVTGASRGIGKAIALAYAREGANVVVAARTESEEGSRLPGTIHKTAEEIRALGSQALPVKCDVTKEEDIEDMVKKTLETFGTVDILVNNAGVNYIASVVDLPAKRWDLVMSVNLRGPFLCSKAVLPTMIAKGSGCIVNISSLAARRSVPTWSAYSVSKAAIERLTKTLALEVEEYGIAVYALAPGQGVITEGYSFVMADIDKSDWVTPESMAKAAVYLATLDSLTLSGEVMTDYEFFGWRDAVERLKTLKS
ncbi:MAG: SDR family NAD(P)-dependent oxidoreductase [Chloroflexi bacterium]|nr:SDR family NAD(P)-dependent oxidoreductase [Chloroflexota bacterium]